MNSMPKTKRSINREIILLYLHASFQHKRTFLLAFLNPIGAMLTNVGVPFYAGRALASMIHPNGQYKTNMIYLIVVAVAGTLANRVGFVSMMTLQAKTMSDLHAMVFQRLLRRGSSFHNNRISGKLISDALDFVTSYGTLLSAVYITGISLSAILVSGLILVGINSWQLGLFLLVTVIVTLVWAYRDSLTRHELRTVRLIATKNLTGHLSDTLVNAQTVKTFAGEDREITQNYRLNKILLDLRMKDWHRAGTNGNNRAALLLTLLVLLLVLIDYTSRSNPAILATGIFAFTYTFTLLLRLFDINTLTRQVEESFLQASPIMQNLLEDDEIVDAPVAVSLEVNSGGLEFSDVQFSYAESHGQQTVFRDFSLAILPGEKLGVVGPSGGGKTTLTRLLLRFEDIQGGSIQIDGQDISRVTQTSLRKSIAYVPQEPLLFHRTIRENIIYGKPDASEADVFSAAKKAFAHDFILQLPKGYETTVGERGVKLSGGQRQRIAIARAILKDAPILILDEATSALDSESEALIQKALWKLMEGRTAIVIAHRLSTIQKMDRIVVLENGKITEQGNHKELVNKKDGTYARLWAHQSGGFIEE